MTFEMKIAPIPVWPEALPADVVEAALRRILDGGIYSCIAIETAADRLDVPYDAAREAYENLLEANDIRDTGAGFGYTERGLPKALRDPAFVYDIDNDRAFDSHHRAAFLTALLARARQE